MSITASKPGHSLSGLSDSELVDLARQRNSTAIELIVRRNNQALFRAARGVLNDDGLAQDIVQESYLKAFTHLESFKKNATLKTWLTRIVLNQALDVRRRHQHAARTEDKANVVHINSPEGERMTSGLEDSSSPENEAARHEMRLILEAATMRLPEIYRCVFLLRDVEGLSTTDTAYCLGVSGDIVKKRLSRAREMLRNDLLRNIEDNESTIFEFAGKRCDTVTAQTLIELSRLGLITN